MHLFPEPETPVKIDGRRLGSLKLRRGPRLSQAELHAGVCEGALTFLIGFDRVRGLCSGSTSLPSMSRHQQGRRCAEPMVPRTPRRSPRVSFLSGTNSVFARAFSKQMESSADSENAVEQKSRAAEPMQLDRNLL